MSKSKFVPLNDRSLLPRDLLELVLDYDPSSNYYLSKEEKVNYKPKMKEVPEVAMRMILNRDIEGLENLTNQSKYNEAIISDIFKDPLGYFKVLDEETKNSLFYIIDNNDKFARFADPTNSLETYRLYEMKKRNSERQNDTTTIDLINASNLRAINRSPYKEFILDKLNKSK